MKTVTIINFFILLTSILFSTDLGSDSTKKENEVAVRKSDVASVTPAGGLEIVDLRAKPEEESGKFFKSRNFSFHKN